MLRDLLNQINLDPFPMQESHFMSLLTHLKRQNSFGGGHCDPQIFCSLVKPCQLYLGLG